MPNGDDAPEGLTGREYVEWVREHQKQKSQEQPPARGARSQNIKMSGKSVPDNRTIPKNQQARRDLNKKLREEQKPARDKEEYEKKHPVLTKARRVAGKVHGAIQKTTSRYVSSREESHRRLERASNEEKERYSDSWVSVSPWGISSLPRKKSKNKPSSRSGGSNDYYGISLTNSLTGASYGGGLGGGFLSSTLPKKSTNPAHKKKKNPTTRRRRY